MLTTQGNKMQPHIGYANVIILTLLVLAAGFQKFYSLNSLYHPDLVIHKRERST